jgi:hypothetical protein
LRSIRPFSSKGITSTPSQVMTLPVAGTSISPRRIGLECVAVAVHSWVTTPSRT